MSSTRFSDYALGLRHLPRMTNRQPDQIIKRYGIGATLRKRTPIMDNPQPCPCIANDDIFNQVNPSCHLCGGTAVIGGEAHRDTSIIIFMYPMNEFGFMGSSTLYTIPGRMERVWHAGFVTGKVPVDIGDFVIESYVKPSAEEVIMEYEVFDKETWKLGQGHGRAVKIIYQKLLLRKSEYAKTIAEPVSTY